MTVEGDQAELVLCVEDNPVNQKLIVALLKKAGYRVVAAGDGLEGIDMARKYKPDLVIMDMSMPGMDGYEATTLIKSDPMIAHIPVVAVTGNDLEGDRERSLIAGCNGYITKPIDPVAFAPKVAMYLEGYSEFVNSEEQADLLSEYSRRLVARLEKRVRQLSVALEEAEEGNRLKSQFLEVMSHELRTPLTVIQSSADMMTTIETSDDEFFGYCLSALRENSDKLLFTVNSVLEHCQLEADKLELFISDVDIAQLLREVAEEFRPRAESKGLGFSLEIPDDMPSASIDSERTRLVISHLADNAIKFTREGDIRVVMSYDKTEEVVRISISDTGIGIAAGSDRDMLRSFRQLDSRESREYGGTGIGLPLCKQLLDLHHGSLNWVSEEGKGSCFTVSLPVSGKVSVARTA
ncbi:MAG: hybrid sensor histidine kinase/response regulator [Gammaproteobacteria bacterium]|nr:hybrid sensor histidine kinase/response regulator [Gammaproteobacteria bacterium]